LGEPLIGHILETRPEGALLVFPIVAASCIAGAVVAPLIRR
jgi:hypothetical protein